MPHHAGGGAQRLHREPRRVRIGEVGQHQHGLRMLEEAVRHLLQGEADVLEADLLADRVERHVREAVVHRAHHARQHRAVADAGVEHAHRRRARMDVAELERDAARHHPLLRAGVDEQQIFLPVVEEAEIALRVGRARRMRDRHRAVASAAARAALRVRSITSGRESAGLPWWLAMKPRMRSSVSVVMRPPLRRRLASLPSLTARRPKVDSARPHWRQKSEISCRMASFMAVSSWPVRCEPWTKRPRVEALVNHKRSHQSWWAADHVGLSAK